MSAVNPWRLLRASPEVELRWAYLDGLCGFYEPHADGTAMIVLDAGIDAATRNATLMHELEHHRRGICGVARYDERGVEDEVARKLVPLDELAQLVASICDDGTPVMAWELAAAFGVPEDVAERACEMLKRERGIA